MDKSNMSPELIAYLEGPSDDMDGELCAVIRMFEVVFRGASLAADVEKRLRRGIGDLAAEEGFRNAPAHLQDEMRQEYYTQSREVDAEDTA